MSPWSQYAPVNVPMPIATVGTSPPAWEMRQPLADADSVRHSEAVHPPRVLLQRPRT